MQYLLTILYAIVCIFLILVILMQRGKDSGGDIFGSGSGAVLSSQGTTSFLVKLTSFLGLMFFLLSLSLGVIINQSTNSVQLKDVVSGLEETKVLEKVVDDKKVLPTVAGLQDVKTAMKKGVKKA